MTTMISEVYSAFRTAGVPEQDARKAAEALPAENLATKNDITEVKQARYFLGPLPLTKQRPDSTNTAISKNRPDSRL